MDLVVEKIAEGVIAGCCVAAYASGPVPGDAGYTGYYKIFLGPVASYFTPAQCIAKGVAPDLARSASDAAEHALAAANRHLERLFGRVESGAAEDEPWAVLQFSAL